jgi:hypothetical protein
LGQRFETAAAFFAFIQLYQQIARSFRGLEGIGSGHGRVASPSWKGLHACLN